MKFADKILSDWDRAMDRFFENVDAKRKAEDLSDGEVYTALDEGYGFEVAEAWMEWISE